MKKSLSISSLLSLGLAIASMSAACAYAADVLADPTANRPQPGGNASAAAPAPAADKNAPRPPLRLQIDTRTINRNAPDRISYAPIVSKTAASVVYVYSTRRVRGQDLTPFMNDPRLRQFFDIPGHSNRTPDRTERGLGSGVVISTDGYILTNNHVVEDADEVTVSIGESTKKYTARVIGRDSLADIAVLKIEPNGALVPATLGDSDQLQVGDVVLAIGNPFGIGQSVSRGIVSALGRGELGLEQLEDFIQTDAAINPGNSGGALIDSDGRVVGINTAILSSSGGFNGVGLAIPINLVRFVAEQIVTKGRVDRGFLGVSTQDLTEDIATTFNSDRGALVNEITPDSPAEKAGLKPGDVILKVNDKDVRDGRHLQLLITQLAPGTEVNLQYLRDGKPANLRVVLGLRPNQSANERRGGSQTPGNDVGVLNGVGVDDITPELRQQLGIPARVSGAIVTSIDPDSASAGQGLREGDVIMELDRRPVRNAEDAVKLSEEIKGPKVTVRVWRANGTRYLVIDESKK
jgi:serine protease Do